jgi:hypothetical protein
MVGCGVVVFLMVLVLWTLFGPKGQDRGPIGGRTLDMTGRFPNSPATYGLLPPGAISEPELPSPPAPRFSWIGKHDTMGLRFVASKRGRYFYPIDHPTAQLIRSEDFVGYKSFDQARADGKIPIQ